MGLFDRVFKHGENKQTEASLSKTIKNQAIIGPNSIENAIAEKMQGIRLEDCTKIPLASIAALGAGFAQMIPSLRTVAQTITVDGMGYIPINNLAGETLKAFSKNTPDIFAGAFKRGGKSVMAQMVKVNPQTITTSTVMPIDPATIIMAAMLAGIEKKLDKLQETQESILSFLEQDKQAEIQGNLNVLTDTLKGYRYNWNNDQYKNNHHMKVLDIKQASERSMVFYQSQIATAIKKFPTIHTEQAVNSGAKKLTSLFRNYRMALYLFGFSSFLECLLLENFREDYLNQIADKVQQYNEHYQNQFSKCRDMIRLYSSGSVEKQVLGGIGNASKALGKLIASSPVLSKGPVDEWLQDMIIRPINRLSSAAAHYSQDNQTELNELTIQTKDEIQSLYTSIKQMTQDINRYIDNLMTTTDELTRTKEKANEMDALAHKDSLTGVGSKLAYDQKVKQLSEDIAQGNAEFGIIMVDLNYLKQLNDTYGHEKGNEAIQKTCRIICDVFKHSPVYRIGGDEFAVIVQDRDYENCEALIAEFNRAVMSTEGAPWEKISAAIGYAGYENDYSVEDVFRRADKNMYERKKEMKRDHR